MDKNKKILKALIDQRDDAGMRKAAAEGMLKKARNPEKKEDLAKQVKTWAGREAKWADEIQFRIDIGFGG